MYQENVINYTERTIDGTTSIPGRRRSNTGFHLKGASAARKVLALGPGKGKVARFEYDRFNINNFRCGVNKEDRGNSLQVSQRKDGNFVDIYVTFKCDDNR